MRAKYDVWIKPLERYTMWSSSFEQAAEDAAHSSVEFEPGTSITLDMVITHAESGEKREFRVGCDIPEVVMSVDVRATSGTTEEEGV